MQNLVTLTLNLGDIDASLNIHWFCVKLIFFDTITNSLIGITINDN